MQKEHDKRHAPKRIDKILSQPAQTISSTLARMYLFYEFTTSAPVSLTAPLYIPSYC